jgi:hypothetical protein
MTSPGVARQSPAAFFEDFIASGCAVAALVAAVYYWQRKGRATIRVLRSDLNAKCQSSTSAAGSRRSWTDRSAWLERNFMPAACCYITL